MEKYTLGASSNVFTAVLPNGTFYPEHIIIEDERVEQFISHFDIVRNKPWKDCVFLDLGCGEGSSTVGLGKTGAQVIGVDGREDIIKRAEYTRNKLGYPNVEFRIGSVLDESLWQEVDAVFMAGLIHHLESPFCLLDLIEKYCSAFVFACTHVAPQNQAEAEKSFFSKLIFNPSTREYKGCDIPGINFVEDNDLREVRGQKKRHPRSGIGNAASWWPSSDALVECMKKAGFANSRIIDKSDIRLRYRFAFYREQFEVHPGIVDSSQFLWPLVAKPRFQDATKRALLSDISYLVKKQISPVIVGEKHLSRMIADLLNKSGIECGEIIEQNHDAISECVESGCHHFIVSAHSLAEIKRIYDTLMIYKDINYLFTSFSLDNMGDSISVDHPVFGTKLI